MPDTLPQTSATPVSPTDPIGSVAKESFAGSSSYQETSGITEIGQEQPLPAEVVSAGVHMQPTTVTLPPAVANMGVKVVGQNQPVPAQAPSISLPLSDDQISQGLNQSITSSWRWLAEWCVRKIKLFHESLRSKGAKNI